MAKVLKSWVSLRRHVHGLRLSPSWSDTEMHQADATQCHVNSVSGSSVASQPATGGLYLHYNYVVALYLGNLKADTLATRWCNTLATRWQHVGTLPCGHVPRLNDLFGIQARGGCACAGPYGQRLLGLDAATAKAFDESKSLAWHHIFRVKQQRVLLQSLQSTIIWIFWVWISLPIRRHFMQFF
jgi:hypothetical protein